MIDVSVRRALPEEAPGFAELAKRSRASGRSEAVPWAVWLAEIKGKLAGIIALSVEDDSAEIEDFIVECEFRDAGVARALMETLVAECRRLGIILIGLDADAVAEPIFWELGFATVGSIPPGSMSDGTLRRMVKPLR